MIDNAQQGRGAREEASHHGSLAQPIRLNLTWSRFGDAIERVVVRDCAATGGQRVVLQDNEISLTTADVMWRGQSVPVDELFAMIEEGFRIAGAEQVRGSYARVSVRLVTDQNDRLAGLAFFAEDSPHEAM
ncbi:hypothetical protein [Pelagibius marinus]|uniref:hypothetical protein n=1 Tax=Pelagibius marinus TaxID=2762760 RepID=UPI00187233F6|nr:hypothetical protein [Pelagibius marinus]